MKKHLFSKVAMCLLSLSMLFFSCNQNNDSTNKEPKPTPQGDAELGKPTEVKVHDVKVKLEDWTVEVPNDKTSVQTGNVKATFKIGGKDEELTPEVKNSPVTLQAGVAVDVVLIVPAVKGKYKAWTQTIKVTQAAAQGGGGGGEDPELTLDKSTFDITGKKGAVTFADGVITVTLNENKEKLEASDIKAEFKLNNTKVENIVLKTEPALPINLTKGQLTQIVLTVDAKPGSYKKWESLLAVTRDGTAGTPALKLQHIMVHGVKAKPDATLGENGYSVNITQDKVEEKNVVPSFMVTKPGSAYPEPISNVNLVVTGLPVNFSNTEQTKTLDLSVAKVEGKYEAWSGKLKITKITKKKATGVSIKIYDDTPPGETDISNQDVGEIKIKGDVAWLEVRIDKKNDAVMTKATVQNVDATSSIQENGKKLDIQLKPADSVTIVLEFAEHETITKTFKLVKE